MQPQLALQLPDGSSVLLDTPTTYGRGNPACMTEACLSRQHIQLTPLSQGDNAALLKNLGQNALIVQTLQQQQPTTHGNSTSTSSSSSCWKVTAILQRGQQQQLGPGSRFFVATKESTTTFTLPLPPLAPPQPPPASSTGNVVGKASSSNGALATAAAAAAAAVVAAGGGGSPLLEGGTAASGGSEHDHPAEVLTQDQLQLSGGGLQLSGGGLQLSEEMQLSGAGQQPAAKRPRLEHPPQQQHKQRQQQSLQQLQDVRQRRQQAWLSSQQQQQQQDKANNPPGIDLQMLLQQEGEAVGADPQQLLRQQAETLAMYSSRQQRVQQEQQTLRQHQQQTNAGTLQQQQRRHTSSSNHHQQQQETQDGGVGLDMLQWMMLPQVLQFAAGAGSGSGCGSGSGSGSGGGSGGGRDSIGAAMLAAAGLGGVAPEHMLMMLGGGGGGDEHNDSSSDSLQPTQVTHDYWLHCVPRHNHPDATCSSRPEGKWMLFYKKALLDDAWCRAKQLFHAGELQGVSQMKVSTARPNPNAQSSSDGVVILYCGSERDEAGTKDIGRNILHKMQYKGTAGTTKSPTIRWKSDRQTLEGAYANRGSKKCSMFAVSLSSPPAQAQGDVAAAAAQTAAAASPERAERVAAAAAARAQGDHAPCECGQVTTQLTSTTKRNPQRRFLVCPKPQRDASRCDFFVWCDEVDKAVAAAALK